MKPKKLLFSIAAILLLAISAFSATLSVANAHSPAWTIPTYAYLVTSYNPIGVGQTDLLVMWLNTIAPTSGGVSGGLWNNYFINVTAPDGTKSQLGPFTSDQLGSTFYDYTPTQAGNYTFVFYWPGQVATAGTGAVDITGVPYIGDFFEPSQSSPVTLTVTQTPAPNWQEPPLPTGYWQLPITDANRGWSVLASNWLGGAWLVGSFQTEGLGPQSPHILWQQPLGNGDYPAGIADAQWPGISYNDNDYKTPWAAPVIMNGIIYYNTPQSELTALYGIYAMNLTSGKLLWYNNETNLNPSGIALSSRSGGGGTGPNLAQTFPGISFGQLYHYYSVNGQGIASYLWMTSGSTWYMLDPSTGNWIMTLTNVPTSVPTISLQGPPTIIAATQVFDQDGSILEYTYNPATGNLLCWNSSQSIPPTGPEGTAEQQWAPRVGAVINAVNDTSWTQAGASTGSAAIAGTAWTANEILPRSGYTMNVTIQAGLPLATAQGGGEVGGSIMKVIQDDNRVPQYIFGLSNPTEQSDVTGGLGQFSIWCVKINYHAAPYSPQANETFTQNNNLGYTATVLYNLNVTGPEPGNLTYGLGPINYDAGVFTIFAKETRQWWGYSLTTGQLLWGPTPAENVWDVYDLTLGATESGASTAYGNLYNTGYGGILYCYNIATGALQWTYTAPNQGDESPYGNYPLTIGTIADHTVYLYSTEHSPTKPLWRGSDIRAVSADTGTELWKVLDFNMGLAEADGYIVSGNQYNNMIECIGKGPSATTVSTQDFAAPLGTSVLVKGTVTDQSPGALGTPAISDAFMEPWMEYLYEQQAMPTNATGVPVTLSVFDPNNNTYTIGTTTSDITGNYATSWTPPITGVYRITATFTGSNSYGGSSAETSLLVSAAPSAQPVSTSTATSTPPATTSTLTTPTPPTTTAPTPAPPSAAPPPS